MRPTELAKELVGVYQLQLTKTKHELNIFMLESTLSSKKNSIPQANDSQNGRKISANGRNQVHSQSQSSSNQRIAHNGATRFKGESSKFNGSFEQN